MTQHLQLTNNKVFNKFLSFFFVWAAPLTNHTNLYQTTMQKYMVHDEGIRNYTEAAFNYITLMFFRKQTFFWLFFLALIMPKSFKLLMHSVPFFDVSLCNTLQPRWSPQWLLPPLQQFHQEFQENSRIFQKRKESHILHPK